jgi:flagellar biosynthesis/type III secretory pathway protein FliH
VQLCTVTGSPPIQLRSDDEMKSGDCRLTGDFGSLDLSLETQLNLLKNGIHESGVVAGNA